MVVNAPMMLTGIAHSPPHAELAQADMISGTHRFAEALRVGHDLTQKELGTLIGQLDHLRLNMSEGERAALQMHVSQFGSMITLAMNVSLAIGKACEKLQQG